MTSPQGIGSKCTCCGTIVQPVTVSKSPSIYPILTKCEMIDGSTEYLCWDCHKVLMDYVAFPKYEKVETGVMAGAWVMIEEHLNRAHAAITVVKE